MEIELKLLLAPADVAAFRRLALLEQYAADKPRSRQLSSTYFDTPDLLLRGHGMELRVRRAGRVWIETLKAAGQVAAGLHQRQEWEVRVVGAQPELAALAALVGPGTEWETVLTAPALAEALGPIFNSVFRRTVWLLRLPQGAEVELALDQGELRRGDAREPISEIELELKAGDPAALFDLALQLQDKIPLRVGNRSKAARGYALLDPQQPSAAKTKPVELARAMTVEQGFCTIASNCLAQIQDNEPGVLRGMDPESLHQMRVGVRRLRSALGLFAKWVPCPEALRTELAWLAGELSAARDADVFADSTLASVTDACPTDAELLRLQQAASMSARAKRQQAAVMVGSVPYSRLMLKLAAWLQGLRWRETLDASQRQQLNASIQTRAAQILARRHKKLRAGGERLDLGTPEERHRIRIAAKKARYAMEFFQSLHPAGRVKRSIKCLAALQDVLGRLNDAAVADGLLRQLGLSQPNLAGSAEFARGFLCAQAERNLRELASLWRAFRALKPP